MEVKIQNLVKTFEGKKGAKTVAVNNMTFDIPDGKLCGLLGPSGCGKSTTLYMIAGIHNPTEGRIFFGNEDVTNVPPENRGIGLVFQNYALYPHFNVRQNIMFPLDNVVPKLTFDEKCAIALENAKIVNIEKLLDRKPKELSGGQQQRVAIARALAKRPRVLLLDEPLSNLDARLRLQTREEIKRIQKETGITTVFVTHDQEEAMSISDFIVVMKDGIVQQKDEPQRVYEEPANLFVAKFLGTPAINVFDGKIESGKLFMAGKEVLNSKELDKVHIEEVICPNCGNVVSHNGKYCNVCGTNIISGINEFESKKDKKSNKNEVVESLPEFDCYLSASLPELENKQLLKGIKKIKKSLCKYDDQSVIDVYNSEVRKISNVSDEEVEKTLLLIKDKISIARGKMEVRRVKTNNDEERSLVDAVLNELDNVESASSPNGLKKVKKLVKKAKVSIDVIPYAHQIDELYKDSDWEGTKRIKEYQVEILKNSNGIETPESKERIEKIISSLEGRLNPIRDCKIGIRAESFVLDPNGPIAVKVFNIEHIGRDISVIGDVVGLEEGHVKIIISSELAKECEGKEILNFSAKRIYVFEETGERIY